MAEERRAEESMGEASMAEETTAEESMAEERTREAAGRAAIPLARSVVALTPERFEQIVAVVAALFRVSRAPGWPRLDGVDSSEGPPESPGAAAVMMGYDFHIADSGPRLIEINTNAGGALINALHSRRLIGEAARACLCWERMPLERVGDQIVDQFRAEFAAVRPGAELRHVAIADRAPRTQFLYDEFVLFRELFENAGVRASIVDTEELCAQPDGSLARAAEPEVRFDLVYWRDTDFWLSEPRSRGVREAWQRGGVVVTPSPHEYARIADKRRLVQFSDPALLESLGVSSADRELLSHAVPLARPLRELGFERAWSERKRWVFKPACAYASKAVYRGDKISRKRLAEIVDEPGYIAQELVTPGSLEVHTDRGIERMKFDVRAYAHRDRIFLLGARAYQGQVTTMRTPGGGFSGVCVIAK